MHPQSHLPNVFLSADIPVPYNLNIQWCLPCTDQCLCLSPLQPQLALSNQHTELPSHTYSHTQTHNRCTDPHECRESGFGVTFHCLSGSGPRPRWLAPPLMCYPTSPHTHPLPPHLCSCSHPSTSCPRFRPWSGTEGPESQQFDLLLKKEVGEDRLQKEGLGRMKEKTGNRF